MFCFTLRAFLCKLETASQNVDDVVNSINTHSIFGQTSYLNTVTAVAAQTKKCILCNRCTVNTVVHNTIDIILLGITNNTALKAVGNIFINKVLSIHGMFNCQIFRPILSTNWFVHQRDSDS